MLTKSKRTALNNMRHNANDGVPVMIIFTIGPAEAFADYMGLSYQKRSTNERVTTATRCEPALSAGVSILLASGFTPSTLRVPG